MLTDKLLYMPRIVWYSPKRESVERKKYLPTLTKKGYKYEIFKAVEAIADFLQQNSQKPFIVVASGKNHDTLVSRIETLGNVAAIFILSIKKKNRKRPSNNCSKMMKFCSKFTEVLTEIETLAQKCLLKVALECTKQSQFKVAKSVLLGTNEVVGHCAGQIAYYHFKTGRVLDFKLMSLLATEQPTPEDILNELLAFAKPGSEGALEIQRRFGNYDHPSFNIMKEFCYVYSTEFIYKEFNKACASRSYHKIIKTLAMLLRELKSQQKRVFRGNQMLYRGIPKGCMKIEDYQKNGTGFWSSFTSTSRNADIAREYAGEGGFIFVINLSSTNTHPNVILDNDWSKFPRQEEVLLLPYFSLKTTKITQKDGYTYVYVQQNESDSVLSLHDISKWTQRIEEELLESVGSEVDRMSQNFCSSIDVARIITSEECKSLFWENIKSICDKALPEQLVKSPWHTKLTAVSGNKELQSKISGALSNEIPEMMNTLMEKFTWNIARGLQTKKSVFNIILEEVVLRPDIYQKKLKNLGLSLVQTSLPWDTVAKETEDEGILNPLIKHLLSLISGSYKSSCEKNLEEKIADILWKGFCYNVDVSRDNFNACSQDLARKYETFFSETKLKLQNGVKNFIYQEKRV